MTPHELFQQECQERIQSYADNRPLQESAHAFFYESGKVKYGYNFTWLGRPIIQLPQDIMAMQELIWRIKPALIIETGIAHGGSLIFYASMLELLGGTGRVIGIDLEIRAHNRQAIEAHPLSKRITMLEGSSVDEAIVRRVYDLAQDQSPVLVALDAHHTHAHVLRELECYAPLVTVGSYIVVFDTAIEDLPDGFFTDRPWGKGNNPKTAVREFLTTTDSFVIDRDIEHKVLITVAPDGYLKRIK